MSDGWLRLVLQLQKLEFMNLIDFIYGLLADDLLFNYHQFLHHLRTLLVNCEFEH